MPLSRAGLGVDRDQTLGEQVVAQARAAIVVVGGGADRQIDPPQRIVGAHQRPDVGVARIPPRVVQPGVGAELVRALRHRVEVPFVAAGADVVGAHPARRRFLRERAVVDARADDDGVADHNRWRLRPDRQQVQQIELAAGRARQPVHQVDASPGAELIGRQTGPGVDRDQKAVAGAPEDPRRILVLPIRHTAVAPGERWGRPRLVCPRVVHPQRLAGAGVDGGRPIQRRAQIQHLIDHQRSSHQRTERGPAQRPLVAVPVGPALGIPLFQQVEHGLGRQQRRAGGA